MFTGTPCRTSPRPAKPCLAAQTVKTKPRQWARSQRTLSIARAVECAEIVALDVFNRADGQPYRLHRWELPDSHPQRFVGSVHDDLVLDERDVLRPASMPVRS